MYVVGRGLESVKSLLFICNRLLLSTVYEDSIRFRTARLSFPCSPEDAFWLWLYQDMGAEEYRYILVDPAQGRFQRK